MHYIIGSNLHRVTLVVHRKLYPILRDTVTFKEFLERSDPANNRNGIVHYRENYLKWTLLKSSNVGTCLGLKSRKYMSIDIWWQQKNTTFIPSSEHLSLWIIYARLGEWYLCEQLSVTWQGGKDGCRRESVPPSSPG